MYLRAKRVFVDLCWITRTLPKEPLPTERRRKKWKSDGSAEKSIGSGRQQLAPMAGSGETERRWRGDEEEELTTTTTASRGCYMAPVMLTKDTADRETELSVCADVVVVFSFLEPA